MSLIAHTICSGIQAVAKESLVGSFNYPREWSWLLRQDSYYIKAACVKGTCNLTMQKALLACLGGSSNKVHLSNLKWLLSSREFLHDVFCKRFDKEMILSIQQTRGNNVI